MFGKGNQIMIGRKLSEETKKKMSESHKRVAKHGENHHSWQGGKVIDSMGYILIYKPEHPNSNNRGYTQEHRLIMEEAIGRILEPEESVHHLNEDTKDNKIGNLILFRNESDHQKYHVYLRIKQNKIDELEKENSEYQKGMIADAKIIKEADNRIIKLEKEIAELKAKCNLCYESMAEKSNKAITELMVDNTKVSEENRILKVKAVARNGRILDLEQCYNNMEDQRDELRKQIRDVKFLNREEVENEFEKLSVDELQDCSFGGVINAICKLAIKPIDKDKI